MSTSTSSIYSPEINPLLRVVFIAKVMPFAYSVKNPLSPIIQAHTTSSWYDTAKNYNVAAQCWKHSIPARPKVPRFPSDAVQRLLPKAATSDRTLWILRQLVLAGCNLEFPYSVRVVGGATKKNVKHVLDLHTSALHAATNNAWRRRGDYFNINNDGDHIDMSLSSEECFQFIVKNCFVDTSAKTTVVLETHDDVLRYCDEHDLEFTHQSEGCVPQDCRFSDASGSIASEVPYYGQEFSDDEDEGNDDQQKVTKNNSKSSHRRKFLRRIDPNFESPPVRGVTCGFPLILACYHADLESVKILIEDLGADVHGIFVDRTVNSAYSNWSPLFAAVQSVKFISSSTFSSSPSTKIRNLSMPSSSPHPTNGSQDRSSVLLKAMERRYELIKYLVETCGAQPNCAPSPFRTSPAYAAFFAACEISAVEEKIISQIQHWAQVLETRARNNGDDDDDDDESNRKISSDNNEDNDSSSSNVLGTYRETAFGYILRNLKDVEMLFEKGLANMRPVHILASHGAVGALRLLIRTVKRAYSFGLVGPNKQNINNNNNNNLPKKSLGELLQLGNDIFSSCHRDALDRVLKPGTPVYDEYRQKFFDVVATDNRTALHFAAMKNFNEVVALLVEEENANVMKTCDFGRNALHYSMKDPNPLDGENSRYEVVRILLSKGCPASNKNSYNQSPLGQFEERIAALKEFSNDIDNVDYVKKMRALLRKYGAS